MSGPVASDGVMNFTAPQIAALESLARGPFYRWRNGWSHSTDAAPFATATLRALRNAGLADFSFVSGKAEITATGRLVLSRIRGSRA